MGAMMWMMMRGTGNRPAKPSDEARIHMLEEELRRLREHRDADPTRDSVLASSKHRTGPRYGLRTTQEAAPALAARATATCRTSPAQRPARRGLPD
jgi:hypothetical protein